MIAIAILLGLVVIALAGMNYLFLRELRLLAHDLTAIANKYCEVVNRITAALEETS